MGTPPMWWRKKQLDRLLVLILAAAAFTIYSVTYRPYRVLSTSYAKSTVMKTMKGSEKRHVPEMNASVYGDDSVAANLSRRIRVLCWVLTQPEHHETRCQHVKATWGRRCNILLFMSTAEDEQLPAVKLPIDEGRDKLWGKTKRAFKYVYQHYREQADWFMKADDDTYVVVENLRYMLSKYSSSQSIYFGCRYKKVIKQGYMSGGAGYVLSRAALDSLVLKSLPFSDLCKEDDTGAEDAELGKCLVNVGVEPMDSRDFLGRGRFFPFVPNDHLFPGDDDNFWYKDYIFYPIDGGMDCCSEHAITFHYITPDFMYVLDYLIYLVPYGIRYQASERPRLTTTQKSTDILR